MRVGGYVLLMCMLFCQGEETVLVGMGVSVCMCVLLKCPLCSQGEEAVLVGLGH